MSICDSIKKSFIRLSKGQRKVAQFVLDNPNVIATQVATEVGRQAGVSESTVIRFCYAMNYSGFSELQEKMKEFLIEVNGVAPAPLKKRATKKQNVHYDDFMTREMNCILNTMQLMKEEDFNSSVQWIHQAENVYILGFRKSSTAAYWLNENLQSYRKNVQLIQYNAELIAMTIAQMTERDVLFVASLCDQHEDIMTILQIAKRKKVKIIVLSETSLGAISNYADVLFVVSAEKERNTISSVAAFSVINAIVETLVLLNKKQYEAYHTKYMNKENTDEIREIIQAI